MESMNRFDFLNKNSLLAVYCNSSATDKFLVGYAVAANKTHIILSKIDQEANYDGLSLCAASSIFRIEYGNNYLSELLLKISEKPVWNYDGDPVEYYLTSLEQGRRVVEIMDEDGSRLTFGIILGHTQSTLRIQGMTSTGEKAEEYVFERALVSRINCGSKLECEIQQLYERSESFCYEKN